MPMYSFELKQTYFLKIVKNIVSGQIVQILDLKCLKHTESGIILQLISIWFVLMNVAWFQPIYFLMPTQVARSFNLAEDSFYQEPERIEGIQFIEDPAKLFKPNDFFREVNKFIIGVQEFVQNPSSSLYSAFNQLQSNAKKNHQKTRSPWWFLTPLVTLHSPWAGQPTWECSIASVSARVGVWLTTMAGLRVNNPLG